MYLEEKYSGKSKAESRGKCHQMIWS